MSERVGLSVALTTHNGARWLGRQLDTLRAQTRPPDELVVVDDASTDASVDVVREFADEAAFPVSVHVNQRTLGPTKNYERAIDLCRGELVALCDQDDEWDARKLELSESAVIRTPRAGAVFTDGVLIGSDGQALDRGLWDAVGFTARARRRFESGRAVDVLLKHNVVSGGTLVFRTTLRPLVLPIPDAWHQDSWIALLLAAVTRLAPIAKPLLRYRQHPDQLHGATARRETLGEAFVGSNKADRYLELAEAYRQALERLDSTRDRFAPSPRAMALLRTKIHHLETRARIQSDGSSVAFVREVVSGRYHRFSDGWLSAGRDLAFGPGARVLRRKRT